MTSLHSLIRTIPDYPKPGIQYRDITTLISNPAGLQLAINGLLEPYQLDPVAPNRAGSEILDPPRIDQIAGIEARGFLFGAPLAYQMHIGFVPIRKPGKLPGETVGRDFDLEYGSDRLELHVDAISKGQKVVLVDDLIATGGTAEAAVLLLRQLGADVVECAFIVALPDLGGIERLEKIGCPVRWLCDFPGE